MRLLQIDSGREWRGGQNQVRLLCRELVREPGVEQLLLTKRDSELARRAAAAGVPIEPTTWEIALDPRAWWQVRRAITVFRPDVIHAHDSHALTLAATLTADRPLVATRRVDFHVSGGWFGFWRRPDRIIAVSQAVKAILASDGIDPNAIDVVPDGVDPDEVRAAAAVPFDIRGRLRLAPDTPIAVNAAALVDHKDHHTLVRAAQHARTLRPDLHWVIAGAGPLRDALIAEIERHQVRDRVHLVGHVDNVEALIAEASVFVMSSKEEGLGSVILNALALERPVVATAGGGIPEILPPQVLVPIGDAAALAEKVVTALTKPVLVPLPERFSAQSMARGVLAVYQGLL